jgi:hypothetical protein
VKITRYLPAIFVLLVLAYLAGSAAFNWWPWPSKTIDPSPRISLLGFLANIVLLAITWVYVITTRDQLDDARKRAKEEDAVRVALSVRVSVPCTEDVKLGIGEGKYKEGPPIYLDVWNFGRPTFMVMEIDISVGSSADGLRPQRLVPEGQVASVAVTHMLMRLASDFQPEGLINIKHGSETDAEFAVTYFSREGTGYAKVRKRFEFFVSDERINTHVHDAATDTRPSDARPAQ